MVVHTLPAHIILGFHRKTNATIDFQSLTMTIRFGTSGWRAIIADEFTFDGVRTVTRAICEQLRTADSSSAKKTIVVGYDTRFLGERFAAECVKELRQRVFARFSAIIRRRRRRSLMRFAAKKRRAA